MEKTKESNTFRFQSFGERIQGIDLRRLALYRIGHENEELEDDVHESLFHQTLKKWMVLNLTNEFSQFSRKVQKIVTLPQLVHQKDDVINQLLEHLASATNLSMEPSLELLYILAGDLREDFYPYFQKVLDCLIGLLNTADANQIEWTFVCLAYLFKSLKPFLKRNIGIILHSILPLLDETRYPEHVMNFAVECFSFVARDIRDHREFLKFLVTSILPKHINALQSCGRLVFEIIRGVRGQFHSTAPDFLQVLFKFVVDEKSRTPEQQNLLNEMIRFSIEYLLTFIQSQQMSVFWTVLCSVAADISETQELRHLVQIYHQIAKHRNGKYLAEMDVVVPSILRLLNLFIGNEEANEVLEVTTEMVTYILLSYSPLITQLDVSRLLKKILTITHPQRKIYDKFIIQMLSFSQFDIFLMPSLIAYFESNYDCQSIELMANVLIHKQPFRFNSAIDQHDWKSLNIQLKDSHIVQNIEKVLESVQVYENDINEEGLLLLVIATHLKDINHENVSKNIEKQIREVLNILQKSSSEHQKFVNLLTFLVEIQCQLEYIFNAEIIEDIFKILTPLLDNFMALNCVNRLIMVIGSKFAKRDELIKNLIPLLLHHEHRIRLLAAHSLQILHTKQELTRTPYNIFYQIECIEPNVQSYREQLVLLHKLAIEGELYKLFAKPVCKDHVVYFLFGLLHHNFKLLWDPVLKLLEDYATHSLQPTTFWSIYHCQLQKINEKIEANGKNETYSVSNCDSSERYWSLDTLNTLLPAVEIIEKTRNELFSYRNILWQRLSHFGKIFELNNREIVTIFLKFITDEYQAHCDIMENSWNLSKAAYNDIDFSLLETEPDNDNNDDAVSIMKDTKDKSKYKSGPSNSYIKSILQTLYTKLAVFAAHNNPKALYRESEMWNLYMHFLSSNNGVLQKLSLDCIMSYKMKAIIPYKDFLYNLLNDKQFKEELINFKMESVEAEHRESFTKILLRLLFGKMMSKGSQKSINAQHKKSLILRFMGQCEVSEIEWFLQMAFGSYEKYTAKSIDILEIPAMVGNDFKLDAVWSPKRLQSALNLLELIRKEFVGIMNEQFHLFILKLIIFIGSVCNEVLEVSDLIANVHPKMPFVFRNTKQLSMQVLYNFFTHIEEFAWNDDLMKCITNVFVFPNLEKLPQDSIHTPTILLKFLLAWGENQKFFSLFAQVNDKGENIFSYIIALLLNPKAKVPVKKSIITLVERLLIIESETGKTEGHASEWSSILIKPHLSNLLQRLKVSVSSRGSKQSLDKQELNVLSMLTKHVTEASTCDQLLQILLPILIARAQTQIGNEVIQQIINTLTNLIRCLDTPEEYLIKIAPLFEHVLEVSSRKLLCELIANIARIKHKQDSQSAIAIQLKYTGRVVFLLNAWDKRWVEQPDYEKRLEILRELTSIIKDSSNSNNEIDLTLGVLVIYNCFYIFRNERDIGLRDNTGEYLRLMVPYLINKYSSSESNNKLNYLLDDVLLHSIQRAIRSSNDKLRYESIRLLGEMARKCPNAHVVLSDLHPLTDAQDAEVDFFENMVHLQTYRHARALLKFCSHAASLKEKGPNVRTLTQIILPLASRYLFQDEQHTKHTLVDAAVETIGIVCQLLPWQQYHALLRYYLTKMRTCHDHQKQCVRLMVRILDAFHFNLSLADPAETESLERLKNALQEPICDESMPEKKEDQQEEQTTTKDEGDVDDESKNESSLENEKNEEDILERNLNDNTEQDDEEKPIEDSKNESCLTRITLLSKNASKRVLNTISTGLIPALNRSITERSSYDIRHKVNRKRFSFEREEDETLRVPIALALVKLMQKLPAEFMETSLPGVFMKVCTFLRSPLKSVRMLTRDMLKKIMLCLSSRYLPVLMDHLQALLTRGFQVHVLTVTVHGILDALRDQLQPVDLEKCLHNILDVLLNDIFGEINAAKEVDKLVAHTPEAKPSAKSFLVLHIIARNIRESCLLDLLIPFREQLARSKLRKLTMRIQECFSKIVAGLVENPNLSIESLLIFIHGTISQSITDLIPVNTEPQHPTDIPFEQHIRKQRPDCFIIPPQPRMRSGAINREVKNNAQANAHILIEFGLEMLQIVLKRKKIMDIDYEAFLNPLLPLLYNSLQSTHSRIIVFAMKTFASIWVEGYKLSKLVEDNYIDNVAKRLFEILKNLSMFGATNQVDNQQLMHSILKGIVSLLRHCPYYKPTSEQMAEIMLIIEQDLQEGDCQVMTFNLLKAIISRKTHSVALSEVMRKISGLAVTSNWENTREECRNLISTYLATFPMKKRYECIIKFFIGQLCYSVISGRLSAIEMLSTIIKKTSPEILEPLLEYLYLSLGTSLVNDENSDCRKAVADCLELLISQVDKKQKDYLFDITILFFNPDNKPSVREMGAALCSRYLNVEKDNFSTRLEIVLEKIVGRLTLSNSNTIGRYVRAPGAIDYKSFNGYKQLYEAMQDDGRDESDVKRFEKALDHELLQMQYCLLKMFEYCNEHIIQNKRLVKLLDELAYESQRMLGHEHSWVRCNAATILSHLIGNCLDFGWIARKLSNDKQIEKIPHSGPALNFIYDNPQYDIKSLILDLCAQVVPGETTQTMIDEIIKIFLYMANILKDVNLKKTEQSLITNTQDKLCQDEENDTCNKSSTITLTWLIYRLRYLIYCEVSKAIHCTKMRISAFTLFEGLITLLDLDSLKNIALLLLLPLIRETSDDDQNIDPDLKQAALRVTSRLRKRIGQELYDQLRTKAQLRIAAKRAERKKILAQEKIQDPVRAAKRKAAAQERKKTAKKLKTNIIRGKVADTKQKMAKRKRKADDDRDVF